MLTVAAGYSQKKYAGYFFADRSNPVQAVVKANSDTLEITGLKIKFIKIEGKVYEIVRSVEIKEAPQGFSILNGWGTVLPYVVDTAFSSRIKKAFK